MANVLDYEALDGSYHEATLENLRAIALNTGGGGTKQSLVNKFGYNTVINTTSSEIIAPFGALQIMSTAETIACVSDSTEDATGGTGGILLLIEGIDSGSLAVSEYVTLNGTSPVNTIGTFLGINRVYVVSTGTADSNVGTLSFTSSTFSTQAQIPPTESVTQQCIYHTPINTQLDVNYLSFSAIKTGGGGKPEVLVRLNSYSRVTETTYKVSYTQFDLVVENNVKYNLPEPIIFGGREVIYLEATTSINGLSISARFSGVLEDLS